MLIAFKFEIQLAKLEYVPRFSLTHSLPGSEVEMTPPTDSALSPDFRWCRNSRERENVVVVHVGDLHAKAMMAKPVKVSIRRGRIVLAHIL